MFSRSLWNPEAWIFMPKESTNLLLIGKNVLIVMVPILINKDVFESSYNDLKFRLKPQLPQHQSNKKQVERSKEREFKARYISGILGGNKRGC